MYESYSWPGAYSLKYEFKLLIRKVKEIFDEVSKAVHKK